MGNAFVKEISVKRKHNPKLTAAAQNLRKNMTAQERRLWYGFLRDYPIRVLRQKVIEHYIVDFYCAKAQLVIEIDGGQHFSEDGQRDDAERTVALQTYGLEVIRFTNSELNNNFDGVCQRIDEIISQKLGTRRE